MIVRAGVLVDADLCGALAAVLAERIRARRDTPGLRRLHAELVSVAATAAANSGRELGRREPVWLTVDEVAISTGRPRRTLTRWCAAGSVLARKDGRRWLMATEAGAPISRIGSSGASRPR
jgi:hypothetical protein